MNGSVLSIWLSEAGLDKEIIGLFALLGIPQTLKFLWTIPVNHLTIPFFKESPRKGWLVFALMGMVFSLLGMSMIDPSLEATQLAFALLSLSLFTGCLYVVGLSYELESIDEKHYGMGSATVVTGYRVGLLSAGAGALYLAYLWDWSWMLRCMAFLLFMGCFFILIQPEPFKSKEVIEAKKVQFSRYSSLFKGFCQELIWQPCQHFLQRNDWKVILLVLLSFKVGDHLAKSMVGPFYLSLGFNKVDLALAYKMWGFAATILGTFVGGYFFKGKNPLVASAITGFVHACSLSAYYLMSLWGKSFFCLYVTVALENFTGGMAMTVFIYLLWKVCDKRYASIQYLLMWSLFSFKADLLACAGGLIASYSSWNLFFLIIFSIGIASSIAIWVAIRLNAEPLKPFQEPVA